MLKQLTSVLMLIALTGCATQQAQKQEPKTETDERNAVVTATLNDIGEVEVLKEHAPEYYQELRTLIDQVPYEDDFQRAIDRLIVDYMVSLRRESVMRVSDLLLLELYTRETDFYEAMALEEPFLCVQVIDTSTYGEGDFEKIIAYKGGHADEIAFNTRLFKEGLQNDYYPIDYELAAFDQDLLYNTLDMSGFDERSETPEGFAKRCMASVDYFRFAFSALPAPRVANLMRYMMLDSPHARKDAD
ncbi:MAG: hypothetical protein CMF22_08000 [Idiomarinaceae bacterium]|nr:hypothetical protein [Idiomarinaceae bacterium]|tara:strand:+ start:2851 stop:3585 length:735 start_codon:yes stop_codon:yes gene_type:complete